MTKDEILEVGLAYAQATVHGDEDAKRSLLVELDRSDLVGLVDALATVYVKRARQQSQFMLWMDDVVADIGDSATPAAIAVSGIQVAATIIFHQ